MRDVFARVGTWGTVLCFIAGCSSDEGDAAMGTGGRANGSGSDSSSGGDSGGSDSGGTDSGGGSTTGGSTSGGAGSCVVDLDCQPEPLPSTGDFSQDCVDRINQFRVGCFCMPPLARWTEAETCARENAEFDKAADSPHAGWGRDGVCSQENGELSRTYNGNATNECPGYGSESSVVSRCLQQMFAEGREWADELGRMPQQGDYSECRGSCYSQYGHFIAMTNASYSMVACGISDEPEFWSVQNFR